MSITGLRSAGSWEVVRRTFAPAADCHRFKQYCVKCPNLKSWDILGHFEARRAVSASRIAVCVLPHSQHTSAARMRDLWAQIAAGEWVATMSQVAPLVHESVTCVASRNEDAETRGRGDAGTCETRNSRKTVPFCSILFHRVRVTRSTSPQLPKSVARVARTGGRGTLAVVR